MTAAEARRPGLLFRFLQSFDPAAARRIHQNDLQKLARAVEITLVARQPATAVQSEVRRALTGYQVLKLGLAPARDQLNARLNQRSHWMFAHGLLEETQRLLALGVSPNSRPMQSLGYKQALAVIEGRLALPAAIQECQVRTRQYAKRQMTWFRAERNVQWLPGFGFDPAIAAQASELFRAWRSGA
jgi:tRNA dimethylallyltransferase